MSCNYETLSPLHTSEIDRLRFVFNRDDTAMIIPDWQKPHCGT